MTLKIFSALVAMLTVVGCSGMVAPTNEGAGPSSTTKNATTPSPTPGAETTGGETTGGETTGGETTGGETTGGDEGGEEPTGNPDVGTVSDETTDIADFKASSTYFTINSAMVGFGNLLYATNTAPSPFKKLTGYGDCVKIPESTGETARTIQIYLSFSKGFTAEHKVSDTGFPKENDNEIVDPVDSTTGITGTFYDSKGPKTGTVKTGTIKFTDGKRPEKDGDEYEVTVDLTLDDGKKYKAKLAGTVVTPPDNSGVTAKTCPEGEYAPGIYED